MIYPFLLLRYFKEACNGQTCAAGLLHCVRWIHDVSPQTSWGTLRDLRVNNLLTEDVTVVMPDSFRQILSIIPEGAEAEFKVCLRSLPLWYLTVSMKVHLPGEWFAGLFSDQVLCIGNEQIPYNSQLQPHRLYMDKWSPPPMRPKAERFQIFPTAPAIPGSCVNEPSWHLGMRLSTRLTSTSY